MILIDEDDPLESGIDLTQLREETSKRVAERRREGMAAIALVLGIFQYRPSRFCILDEVDALWTDERGPVQQQGAPVMSRGYPVPCDYSQADDGGWALYGVTMEELGVSKLPGEVPPAWVARFQRAPVKTEHTKDAFRIVTSILTTILAPESYSFSRGARWKRAYPGVPRLALVYRDLTSISHGRKEKGGHRPWAKQTQPTGVSS
jgi:hypothetical protein